MLSIMDLSKLDANQAWITLLLIYSFKWIIFALFL